MYIGFLLLLSVFSSSVLASKLNIVTENLHSLQYYDKGEIVGSGVDKVKAVLKHANIKYTLGLNPWPVSYIAAIRDPNTCIFSIGRLKSREDLFTWVFPITHFTTSFYGLKSQQIIINSLSDAKNYKTGVISNDYSHQYLTAEGFTEEEHLVLLSSFDRVFELLEARKGLLDLVILSDAQFTFRSSKNPITRQLKKYIR
jgi:polar amino acid transport system substrate-binding protein